MVVFIAVPPTDFAGLGFASYISSIISSVSGFDACYHLLRTRTAAAITTAAATGGLFRGRTEVIAQIFQVAGPDPFQALLYGPIAMDAAPQFRLMISG
jgi:hypothetical protein